LTILGGEPLPQGWTGKLWAMKQGVAQASSVAEPPRYLLLTDADISYQPNVIRRLVARAEAGSLVLTSLMVKLRCESLAERALIPAFVFFFQMLYPFAWTNRRDSAMAAAAGGCMLVRRDALEAAGGIEAIRSSLIDDCALGHSMKKQGPIWLGLSDSVHSLRPYPGVEDIRRMVSRSAYDQLNYSPLLLAGTVAGMLLTYLLPLLFAIFGTGVAQAIGALTWGLMSLAFLPIIRFYRLSPLWAFALPVIAALYMVFTLDSAVQHWRGRGGLWKGRVQARRAEVS
jgi:hopene-associated glycosyltransferase HpnB